MILDTFNADRFWFVTKRNQILITHILFTVTNDELFGIINPATREWKDGLFSVLMRDQANLPGDNAKWIILDGDIDPM